MVMVLSCVDPPVVTNGPTESVGYSFQSPQYVGFVSQPQSISNSPSVVTTQSQYWNQLQAVSTPSLSTPMFPTTPAFELIPELDNIRYRTALNN